ncbi:MAG TPA: DUF3096 domain-containing protein [Cyclobacteriaceae bacterium]|nr:DUF3096 domain-containing protein [Cyclobacteriaceae bacterium]
MKLSNIENLDSEKELRLALYLILYKRLEKFFASRNVRISRDTDLKSILKPETIQSDWKELNSIGLTMPMLKMPKFLNYIVAFYLVCIFLLVLILMTKYFQYVAILWDLPIIGVIVTLTGLPISYFVFLFKRNRPPCDTIDELIEYIISIHWSDLIKDDNKILREILLQEIVTVEGPQLDK